MSLPRVVPVTNIDEGSPEPTPRRSERAPLVWGSTGLVLVIVGLVLGSLLVGAGDTRPEQVIGYLLGDPVERADPHLQTVVETLRVPRTVVGALVGAAMGVAGALLQAATRNPLAETGLLGVNAGAALAVVVGITFVGAESGPAYLFWAFTGALLASAVVLLIAALGASTISPLRLVLAGAALGATFRGLTSWLLIKDATTYDQYRFWVLGSLSGVSGDMATDVLPAIGVGLLVALLVARPLSALHLGDDVARSLGHRPSVIRSVVALAVTLLAGASVALTGPIGFLGLLAPHAARFLVGPRMLAQVVLAGLLGTALLLTADIVARVIIRPFEAPVSVLLALVGGPALVLLTRSRRMITLTGGGGRA